MEIHPPDRLAHHRALLPFQKNTHCLHDSFIAIQSQTVLPDSNYFLVSKAQWKNGQLIWWKQRDQNNIPVIVTGGRWELSFFFLTFQMTSNLRCVLESQILEANE